LSGLLTKPIPRVLSRHQLLMGCEREPLLVSALIFGGVAVSSMTFVAFIICGSLWGLSLMIWRRCAKVDPYLVRIYQRSLRHPAYYPAFSRPYRKT
jgi:type IV secretory pathway TrbD component